MGKLYHRTLSAPARLSFLAACFSLLLSLPLAARDAYFVRFNAAVGRPDVCDRLIWRDDVYLYNTTSSSATVRLLGVSNGTLASGVPTSFDLSPGELVSFHYSTHTDVPRGWVPEGTFYLWVIHLDIPAGIVAESRNEMTLESCFSELGGNTVGKVSMPMFTKLVPPGETQVTLGTDLGNRTTRINVGIYNAGADTATADISVRRACNGSVVSSRRVSISPNTIVQIGGFDTGTSECSALPQTAGFGRYVTVTVDQPSFSYVANVSEDSPITTPVNIVPAVGVAVANNTRF